MGVGTFTRRRLILAASLALGALTASSGAAAAEAAKELRVTSVSPANGASLTAFANPYPDDVTFTITTPETGHGFPYSHVTIASQNAVNGSGRLYPELTLESLYLHESERYPETYTATSLEEGWATKPGTYYWQVEVEAEEVKNHCLEYGGFCTEERRSVVYFSPVYTLIIAPPAAPAPTPQTPVDVTEPETPVPPLSVAEAATAARSLIHTRTHHSAYRLSIKCKLTGTQAAICTAAWFTANHVIGSTPLYAGTFKIDAAYEPATVTFHGFRALDGCVLHNPRHLSRCNTRVNWH